MATPTNKNSRKPIKKKTFDLNQYKVKTNAVTVPDKPLEWIQCSKALQEQTGLLGFPRGYVTLSRGFSNTGKSTSLLEGMVASQKSGSLPVIFDVENNLGKDRLTAMGFDWNGEHILVQNDFLLKEFGRKVDKNRGEASIEDLAMAINFFLDEQEAGYLPRNLDFYIDSIGVLNCVRSINAEDKGTSDNNMWNAGAYERAFKYLLNNRIPASRKEDSEFTNSLAAVQKIWIDNMGAGVVKHKGGEAFYFGSRLIYHFGGIAAHGAKGVSATSKGKDVSYGIKAKVSIAKNHIDGPLGGISMDGEVISTPHGFIGADKDSIDKYKKENILFFRKILGEEVTAEEINTKLYTINTIGDEKEMGIDDFNNSMDMMNFNNDIVDTDTGEVKE